MSTSEGWKCKLCTLSNSPSARRCAACNRPRGRTRSRAIPKPSVTLAEDRAYAASEEIVVEFVNPHQNSFDVVSIIPLDNLVRDSHWPIPGVTTKHWKYVGHNSEKRQWNGCLQKEPVEGSVRFEPNVFKPATYQIQLRYFKSGSWSNVQARSRLDITATTAQAKNLPPPSAHASLNDSEVPNFPPKRKHRALVGLQNIGNTCYMNAAVQCLVTLTPMMDAFLARMPGPEPPSSGREFLDRRKGSSAVFSLPLDSPKLRSKKSPSKVVPIEPKVELEEGEWRCTACTLTNKQGEIRCQLCGKLAGREVRDSMRRQDVEHQPQVQPVKSSYEQEDMIEVEFKDPIARPYTVLCVIPTSVPNGGEGTWPIPGWDSPGLNWQYTDGSCDGGIVGLNEGTVAFSAKRIGGGEFEVQLRYYLNGSWTDVQARSAVTIVGEPLKRRRKTAPEGLPEAMAAGANGATAMDSEVPSSASPASNGGGSKAPNGVGKPTSSIADAKMLKVIVASPGPPAIPTELSVAQKPSPRRKALKPGVLSNEFTRLVHTLSNFQIDGKYICPEYLKFLIEYVRPEFKGTGQHDCQEFTQALLDELNRDLNRVDKPKHTRKKKRSSIVAVRKNRKRKPLKPTEDEPPSVRAGAMLQALQRPTGSLISEMFFGMLENRIECQTCLNQSTTYSTFSTVSLDIPLSATSSSSNQPSSRISRRRRLSNSSSESSFKPHSLSPAPSRGRGRRGRSRGASRSRRGRAGARMGVEPEETPKTLHECFQDFTKQERLCGSNEYYCSKCKTRGEATKRMMFYHLPPVLIIHLKRFSADGSGKAESDIAFPNELDLSRYCLRSRENIASFLASREIGGDTEHKGKRAPESPPVGIQDCRYRLVGVVNHQQNDGYKHYTALTLAKLNGNGHSRGKNTMVDDDAKDPIKKKRVDGESQPYFGCVYENNRAGWVEFDDEKAWHLSTHQARSERASERTRREAYLLFYEAAQK
mmetsp:Transcript_39937/g.77658  ORF Transcript_39937/g.77658 Transcript_39937/m.77658 type:complete len:981 (-) Transcript_39937:158-3100(-)